MTLRGCALLLIPLAIAYSQTTVTVDPTVTYQTQKFWQITPSAMGPGPSCVGIVPCNPDWDSKIEGPHMAQLAAGLGVNTMVLQWYPTDAENTAAYFNCGILSNTCERRWPNLIPPVHDGADVNHIRCNGTDYTWAQTAASLWKAGGVCAEWQFQLNDYLMDKYFMGTNGLRQAIISAGRVPHLHAALGSPPQDWTNDSRTANPYGELAKIAVAFFIHNQNKYGVVPDVLSVVNEPDLNCNGAVQTTFCQSSRGAGWYTFATVASTATAVKAQLAAEGYTPALVVGSVTNSDNAVGWYNGVKALTGPGVIDILGYHTYSDSLAGEQGIAAAGIPSYMNEYAVQGVDNSAHNLMFGLLNGNLSSSVLRSADAAYAGTLANATSMYTISSESSWTVGSGSAYASQYTSGKENSGSANSSAWFYPQLSGYIPEGSVREKATFTGPFGVGAVAYKLPDGTHRVVMIVGAVGTQAFHVSGIPAGTYGCTYTISNAVFKQPCGANQTITAGGTVNYTIPNVPGAVAGATTLAVTVFGVSAAPPPPPPAASCDVNGDGVVNILDVQLSIEQDLAILPCISDVSGDGKCDPTDVQKIITTALGGACH